MFSTIPRAPVAAFLVAAAGACGPAPPHDPVVLLHPFASTSAPLSVLGDVALLSDQVACTVNSFESRIHCVDSRRRIVGVFGREGEGPGEFRGFPLLMRGPDGTLAVFELSSAQLTFFQPTGSLLSETRMPPDVFATDLQAHRVLGYRLAMLDRTRSEDQPDYIPVEVDAFSGEILWERHDLTDAVERNCFDGRVGILHPAGGLVTTACDDYELVFFDHRDAGESSVVPSPNFFEAFPNDRDVAAYVDGLLSIGGGSFSLSPAQKEAYAGGYREKPKRWFLGGPASLKFDGEHRLWAATTIDRDTFSYFEIWAAKEYTGTLRIRDRLIDYDILGSTLVALVERTPDRYGVAQRAIDWYDISQIDFAAGK